MKFTLLLLVSYALTTMCAAITFSEILDVVQIGKDVVIAIGKTWNLIDDHFDVSEVPLPIVSKRERVLVNRMNIINSQIAKVSREVEGIGAQTITVLLKTLPERINIEMKLNDLKTYMTNIDVNYNRMSHYIKLGAMNNTTKRSRSFERVTLEDFAMTVVSHDTDSVQSLMERIHVYFNSQNSGIVSTDIVVPLKNLGDEIDGGTQCSMKESPQQMLLNLYNSVATTELKAYTMIQFSYMLLKLYGKGNFTNEAEFMKERYLQRTTETVNSMRDALERASRKLWICDPKKYVKNENYLEITELLQGYIQNEVDLNEHGTCRENCAEYKYTKSHSCYMNLYCKQQRRCNGKIINCQFIDSDAWICPSGAGTNRRYEYIEYENGRVLGRKKGCTRGTTKVDSWWRWLFWHCSYCVCMCDEQGSNSDRYINMQPSLVDIQQNRVATGLRFTKIGRIIYLQIQEGELLKGGKISGSTVRWVPIDAYNITDMNVRNGKDYHTLTFENRGMDLDDLEEKEQDALLTGVRFEMIGSHMNFQIRLTPFDFVTGTLQPEKSYWKSNHNTDAARINPRRKLDLEGRDIPTRAQSPSQPDSQSDSYFEFTNTDLDRDVAQTTVPFFDSQDVDSLIPVPLAGAGLYHKGLPSFGGFVAPKIITYNYHTLLNNAVNDLELNPDVLVN